MSFSIKFEDFYVVKYAYVFIVFRFPISCSIYYLEKAIDQFPMCVCLYMFIYIYICNISKYVSK